MTLALFNFNIYFWQHEKIEKKKKKKKKNAAAKIEN
jgi:hypothetical protein